MKRMHVMLQVDDLGESIRFYSALFGASPTVQKGDYAKWMLEDPRLNLSISDRGAGRGIEHLGIQAESPEELTELRNRIARAGGTVTHEGETTCCYAQSDKSWVVDAQGVAWEAFYTHGVAETYTAAPQAAQAGSSEPHGSVGERREAAATQARTDAATGRGCCAPTCCEEAAGGDRAATGT